MRVKIVHQGKTTVIEDFALVLVEQRNGTPLAVAAEAGIPGAFLVSSIDSPAEFHSALQQLGLDRTIITENLADRLRSADQLPYLIGKKLE